MNERLKKQMDFIMEVDGLKNIFRQTYIKDGSRKENDTEHSWHLAMMAFLLAEHANEAVDVSRVMMMVLIHDVVELDAGDTYAYDDAGNATKRQREVAAANRIFGLLPKDQQELLMELWEEFEQGKTPEAKFANTLDRVQPVMLNDAADGKAWLEHGVFKEQIMKRNVKTHEGSEAVWDFAKALIEENVEKGNIKE